MKKLNIAGIPVLIHLAEITLFERIQDTFDLHPGRLVGKVKWLAEREGKTPGELLTELRRLIPDEFDHVLGLVDKKIRGEDADFGLGNRKYAQKIRTEFRLFPMEMVKSYPKKAASMEMNVKAFIAAARLTVPHVINWTLDEVEKILRKEGAMK